MTTVLIWNNNEVRYKFAKLWPGDSKETRHPVTGHAAVNITGTFVFPLKDVADAKEKILNQEHDVYKLMADNREHYVSWWPHNAMQSHSGHTRGRGHPNFWYDLLKEMYAPDHVIYIPSTTIEHVAMQKEWKSQREAHSEEASYRFYAKNCSTMASRILKAGFGSKLSTWHSHATIWTPLKVKRLALSLDGAIDLKWSDFVDSLCGPELGKIFSAESGTKLKAYMRRASTRGKSDAPARFDFEHDEQHGKNTASFLSPPLELDEASYIGRQMKLADVAEIEPRRQEMLAKSLGMDLRNAITSAGVMRRLRQQMAAAALETQQVHEEQDREEFEDGTSSDSEVITRSDTSSSVEPFTDDLGVFHGPLPPPPSEDSGPVFF